MPLGDPIIVVSSDPAARVCIENHLNSNGYVFKGYSNFSDAAEYATNFPCSGLIADMPTIIRSRRADNNGKSDKHQFDRLSRAYLTAVVKVLPDNSILSLSDKTADVFGLRNQKPSRKLRKHRRYNFKAPVALAHAGEISYVTSTDISLGGMFIIDNATNKYSEGEEVLVGMDTMPNLLKAVVVRIVHWGAYHCLPGIGIKWSSPLSHDERVAIESSVKGRHHAH